MIILLFYLNFFTVHMNLITASRSDDRQNTVPSGMSPPPLPANENAPEAVSTPASAMMASILSSNNPNVTIAGSRVAATG
jgi:hypothetical protein